MKIKIEMIVIILIAFLICAGLYLACDILAAKIKYGRVTKGKRKELAANVAAVSIFVVAAIFFIIFM